MMADIKLNNRNGRIGKYLQSLFNIEQLTAQSLLLALSQFSSQTLIVSTHLFRPLTQSLSQRKSRLVVVFQNCRIIIDKTSSYRLLLLSPLCILEYKYFTFSNHFSKVNNSLTHKKRQKKKKFTLQKPALSISITYIEADPPTQYINYGDRYDINSFYNKGKDALSKSIVNVLPCSSLPILSPLKKSISPSSQSIKGKSFEEIYETIIQIRNEKKANQHEEGVPNNHIIYSALLKNNEKPK